MNSRSNLREDHLEILRYLAKSGGWQRSRWIAEWCDHWFDTPWATARLATLKRRGLVLSKNGSWRIVDAGLDALQQAGQKPLDSQANAAES